MSNWDVIVVGLGTMGSAAAASLARRGVRVLGLERFEPAHDRGSGHGGSRIIRQAYFEGPDYVPLLWHAYDRFGQLEAEVGGDLMMLCGAISIGEPDDVVVTGALESARHHGLDHELLDSEEIRRRYPTMAPQAGTVGLYEDNAGFVRPERVIMAHVEVARRHGADLRFNQQVTGWRTVGGGVEVTTSEGVVGADRLVIAPGAWAPKLLTSLALPLSIERQVFYWFQPDFSAVPYEAWEASNHPVYIDREPGSPLMYGFPMTDGPEGGFKLGFLRETTLTDPDAVDREIGQAETERFQRRARELFPHLSGPLVSAKTCLYTFTPDEHFVIGLHPESDAVAIACGFSAHGFKFAPAVGDILGDLAMMGKTDLPIAQFDPTRFG